MTKTKQNLALNFEPNLDAMRFHLDYKEDIFDNGDVLEDWLCDKALTSKEMVMELTGLTPEQFPKVFCNEKPSIEPNYRALVYSDEACNLVRKVGRQNLTSWQIKFRKLLCRYMDGRRFENVIDEYVHKYLRGYNIYNVVPDYDEIMDSFYISDQEFNEALQDYAKHHAA